MISVEPKILKGKGGWIKFDFFFNFLDLGGIITQSMHEIKFLLFLLLKAPGALNTGACRRVF